MFGYSSTYVHKNTSHRKCDFSSQKLFLREHSTEPISQESALDSLQGVNKTRYHKVTRPVYEYIPTKIKYLSNSQYCPNRFRL